MSRADRTAVVVLVLLPVVLLAPALLPGRVLSPLDQLFAVAPWRAIAPGPVDVDPALGDIAQVFHPWTLYASREIRAGRFPFWNPYSYAGAPFFSNPQTALLFPLTALTWVLPPALALTLPSVLKLIGTGLAMYWMLRVLAVVPFAAFVGASGLMLSSTMIAWLPWTLTSTVAFLPLIFGGIERLAQQVTRRRIAILALVVGLDALAGYPQATFHALLAAAAWTLTRASWHSGAVKFLGAVAAAVALGAGLAAAQALPALDYLRESAVFAYRAQWTAPGAVPISATVTALMPVFFGTGVRRWSVWQFAITSTYVGLVPLLGIPLATLRTRRSPAIFFAGLIIVVASVHYGLPLLSSAIAYAPGMALGTNTRLTLLLVFGLSALGALGLDAALRAEAAALRRAFTLVRAWTIALLAAGVLAVWLAGADPRAALVSPPLFAQYVACAIGLAAAALLLLRWLGSGDARWGVALAGVQVLSLAPLAATYWPVHDTAWLYPTPPAIAWLRQHAPGERVMIADTVGLLYELRQAHGYDGLTPRRIEDLAGPIGTARPRLDGVLENTLRLHGSEPLSPLAVLLAPTRPLLGVRRLVLAPGTVPPEPGLRLVYDGADARIFEDPVALPRAVVATGARCADDRSALHLLRTRTVDSAHEVVLAGCDTPPRAGAPATRGEAHIVEETPSRVRVSASADGAAWLVLGDTWFPGWRARLDGVDTPIWRANHAFRAVALPPGRHEIEFTFVPRGLFVGMALSVVAALVIVALLLPRSAAAGPTVATVVAGVIVLGASPAALAALPAPPFELSLTPAAVNGGGSVTVSVKPRGAAAGGALDAYIVWLDSERAAFLQPDGRWSLRPVPWRAGLQGHERADGVWRGAGPPGSITLALVVVEPGGDPLDRGGWRFRPALATLHVAGPPAQRAWDQVVVPMVVAALSALLVIGWPLPRPPGV